MYMLPTELCAILLTHRYVLSYYYCLIYGTISSSFFPCGLPTKTLYTLLVPLNIFNVAVTVKNKYAQAHVLNFSYEQLSITTTGTNITQCKTYYKTNMLKSFIN